MAYLEDVLQKKALQLFLKTSTLQICPRTRRFGGSAGAARMRGLSAAGSSLAGLKLQFRHIACAIPQNAGLQNAGGEN